MCSSCILVQVYYKKQTNYNNKKFKKEYRLKTATKSMETRKPSGWLKIVYQNLVPTFLIHFLIRLANHKFWQKVEIKFWYVVSSQPEFFLVSILFGAEINPYSFKFFVILVTFKTTKLSSAHQPAVRHTSTRCIGPVFGTTKVTAIQNTDLLFWSRFLSTVLCCFHPLRFCHMSVILHHIIHLL